MFTNSHAALKSRTRMVSCTHNPTHQNNIHKEKAYCVNKALIAGSMLFITLLNIKHVFVDNEGVLYFLVIEV